ncbi:MAG: hypothetical protein ACPGGG_03335 [Parvibaculales bacterium]
MSEELEGILGEYFFKTTKELSSYSDALESRVRDRFMDYFVEIKEVGSSEENAQILHNARIIVQKKQRRALDFVDVEAFFDRIEVRSNNDEALSAVQVILRDEKGFKNMSRDDAQGVITIKLPKPSLDYKIELSDFVGAKFQNFQKNVVSVKSQTGQQIRAGINNEFIFAPEAARASKEIDQIINHYLKHSRVIMLTKQRAILGREFTFDKEEDALLKKDMSKMAALVA